MSTAPAEMTYLNDSFLSADFKDLTSTGGAVGQSELDDLIVRWELEIS